MILVSYLPWFIALIGILVYALTTHKNLGLVFVACGTLVGLIDLAQHVVRLG